ncbi:beta strand repeat-containing protein [Psychrobacter okhotskensis]|uniref:beta strand repeat-containing protein n=1 Tax=Psychrobacter okhotskensis TaxID=212403 RepID=UPI0019190353|nr:DUF11 domain-containing protein [Psychrobacter okhotskensis]
MKANLFKHSVLTVGVIAALGGTANAANVTYDQTNAFKVKNIATATYNVAGNNTPQKAESNEVTVNVTETGAFSLIPTSEDGNPNDDFNKNLEIVPKPGATVDFTHTLKNDGNVADTYQINIGNASNDQFDYAIAKSIITYQKVDANGKNVGNIVTVANAGDITLGAGESAKITITAKTDVSRTVGKNGILTVSATSAYLNGKGQTATANNTDNAITTTPIYAITKSAVTNLGTRNIDLNNANAYVDYTISVTNEGNADGTDVTIEDALPNGLTLIKTGEANYVAPTIKRNGTVVTIAPSTTDDKITFDGVDIDRTETITITFRAKKSANATITSDFVNYAVVKDDVDGDGTFDLIDNSGDKTLNGTPENNYEDSTLPADRDGKDNNNNAAVTPTNQNRNLTIAGTADKEVALQSQNNVYNYTITNSGTDVTEASKAGDVLFTVSPTEDNQKITIAQVFVDTNNNGVLDDGETILTANPNNQYDLNQAAPNGLASATGNSPVGSVIIGVVVNTNGSGSKKATGSTDIGTSEKMTITLLPQTVINGTPAPAQASTTSKTTMQGIDLDKFQAVAACGTAPTAITNWVTSDTNATAGACIFYKLEAINTFTTIQINDVVLSDTLTGTTYQNDFASDTSANSPVATSTFSGSTVTGTFGKLVGKEIGNVYFSTKISQTGTN